MRRYLMGWTFLLGAVLGCQHTAGVCDCDTSCCGAAPLPGVLRPEPLRMPGVNGESKPAALGDTNRAPLGGAKPAAHLPLDRAVSDTDEK